MATWNDTLNVSSFYHDDSLTIREKAKAMSDRIKAAFKRKLNTDLDTFDDELDRIHFEFTEACQNEHLTANDFDEIMSDLYDWADYERVWITTR